MNAIGPALGEYGPREYCPRHGYVDTFVGRVFTADSPFRIVVTEDARLCVHCHRDHPDNPEPPMPAIDMRALRVLRGAQLMGALHRSDTTIFVPLPQALWRPIRGGCACDFCRAHPDKRPHWDTLAIARDKPTDTTDTTWLVHMPEAHE